MGHGTFSVLVVHRHFFTVIRMPADGLVDGAFLLIQLSETDGTVSSVDGMFLQLFCNAPVCFVIFAGNDRSSGILVDTMYNTGAQYSVDPGQIPATVIHQCINQSAAVMSRRRMHHHPLRLIHHDQIRILIQDIQRDVLRFNIRFHRFRHGENYFIITFDTTTSLYRRTVYQHISVFDQLLDKRTGQILHKQTHTFVNPFVFHLICYLKSEFFHYFISR